MQGVYEKKRWTLDAITWTPITAPYDCNTVTLRNLDSVNNIKLRTQSGDANTEDILTPDLQEHLGGPSQPGGSFRFSKAQTVVFAQTVAGTGPLLATYLV